MDELERGRKLSPAAKAMQIAPSQKGSFKLEQKAALVPVQRDLTWVYRYSAFAVWLFSTILIILDRIYWNVWPRQTICTDGCGNDFFCDMDESPGCLKKGPWSVKTFDFIARASARLIISTTNLIFLTMCHSTWNYLSEVEMFRPFLYRWRSDNRWLHVVGGWTMGIWVVLHVWSLLLPSLTDGYDNVKVDGEISWPLQVSLPGGNIDVPNRLARWGVDDIWRIFWMTVIFGALMPLSRSTWALTKNYSLSMWLHMALGGGFFFDSWRRRTHPHVWILNTPVVLWYLADKYWSCTRGRVDPCAEAERIVLDEDYMLLVWKQKDSFKRICDIFWLKCRARDGNHAIRTGEMAHPFTSCSSHDVVVPQAADGVTPYPKSPNIRPTIELPIKKDVSWPGHRFSLNSTPPGGPRYRVDEVSRSSSLTASLSMVEETHLPGQKSQHENGNGSVGSARGFGEGVRDPPCEDKQLPTQRGPQCPDGIGGTVVDTITPGGVGTFRQQDPRGYSDSVGTIATAERTQSRGRDGLQQAVANDKFCDEQQDAVLGGDDLLVGADTESATGDDEIRVVFASIDDAGDSETGRRVRTIQSSQMIRKGGDKLNGGGESQAASPSVDDTIAGKAKRKCMVIKRLPTQEFHEFRKREAETGRMGQLARGGAWDKMAIIKIHNGSPPKARECSCMGYTHVLTSYRRPETTHIANLESAEGSFIPLRTYGPYRSEYGRLGEFPNLPPLLIIATGAGAALALDFMGYVRANKLTPARGVTICYSSASLALLQFVTNNLLAERIPGIHIKTALTRHDELELFDTTADRKEDLSIGRLDVMRILDVVSADTEVYFCGGGTVNGLLRKACAKRRMKYVGSSVS